MSCILYMSFDRTTSSRSYERARACTITKKENNLNVAAECKNVASHSQLAINEENKKTKNARKKTG